ncbi:RNA polymerase sigma factor [Pedobacter punctiformis]|uniref:Sigma-70 family RNA polymerase sigma factor n=1 Tax=Pedobacter punctiformis TaxID=3004097 RepID=A0ABT4L5I6_9SPHI|nr:sigma-70 family RNA polymerase sigma factor [Pedobacter sp. HCMS5-2]MCZ4243186.1 sigma-70 family RNA polymerase sigma factor [Pedobacter sp. HCMS5-2]
MEQIFGIKSGSLQAFQSAYQLHHGKLYAYILKKTGSAYLAEEVVQLTFIRLWEKRQNLSLDYSLAAQIFKMGGSILIDQLRKEAVSKKHLKEIVPMEILHIDEQSENAQNLELAINQMAPMRKKVFKLSKIEGYSYKEIAEELSISPKTVENHISKALKQLRAALSSFFSIVAVFSFLINR